MRAESSDRITAETVAAAERIAGVRLTDEEREAIVDGLEDDRGRYLDLRERGLEETEPPALVFRPLPAGERIPSADRRFRYTETEVRKPSGEEELAFLSARELGALVRARQISSLELTRLYLDRLKRFDKRLLFVVNLTEELAIDQARRADRELASGFCRGPLHGVPYGVKDLFSVRGYPTTWGAEPFIDRVIERDATVVERLEEAGAVLVAKLATGRLASGADWFGGMTRNPWNPDRQSGGSSAGPASATAAGCVGFAIGTETNGSMVSPCNECGVTGLRPTFGRVSRHGCMTVSWSFDKVTPIGRSVEDCALVLNAIEGPDAWDNSVIEAPFGWDPDLDLRNLRIGYHRRFFERELPGNPTEESARNYWLSIREQSINVLEFFRDRGVDLVPLDFELPTSSDGLMLEIEAAAAFDELSRGDLDDRMIESSWPVKFRRFRFAPAVEYLQGARFRSAVMRQMQSELAGVDLFFEITWSNNWHTNVTGHPCVVVPCGFAADDWPVTITFVGKLYREAEMLAVAKTFQDSTSFHLRRPILSG